MAFNASQITQFKRDARRISKSGELTHAQALDRVARNHGFVNWSLLVRSAERDIAASPVLHSFEELKGIKLAASRTDKVTILAIARRYVAVLELMDFTPPPVLETMMDIEACHCNGNPIDLVSLLEASSNTDLIHDVAGINKHLDRDTGRLMHGFTPRYSQLFHQKQPA